MLSALYYLLLVLLCTLFMILSALALVVCYPFDRGRRTVHELSRILVRIFFFLPPLATFLFPFLLFLSAFGSISSRFPDLLPERFLSL